MGENFFKDIRIIGFDFDNTLVDEQYFIKTRWEKVLKKYSRILPGLKKTFFKIYSQKGTSYKFHLDDAFEELNGDAKVKQRILSELRKTSGDELLLKGAIELIGIIKEKGLKIGIITDGARQRQKKRIKNTGLYKFMDFIYYGSGMKEKKPNKKVIEEIFKRFKINFPRQFLYIGNDFITDIEGMLSIGAKACWVTRGKSNPGFKGLIKVKNLKELSDKFNHE